MKEPKSLNDLFKDAWKLFTDAFGTYIGILGVGILIEFAFIIPGVILFVIGVVLPSHKVWLTVGIASFSLFILLGILAQFWIEAALVWALNHAAGGNKVGVRMALAEGWKIFGRVLWVMILAGLIIFGGYLLLIIPGIILAIYFSFVVFVAVVEKKGGVDALWRSKEIVSGHFWRVLGITLLVGLLTGLANQVAGPLAYLFLTPFWTAILYYLYKDLKEIRGT
jgi:hypothetical protein